MTAAVTIDVNGCFAHAAGPEALDRSDLDALAARAAAVLADIEARRAGGDLAYFDQVAGDEAVEASSALAATLAGRFDRLVVLGIGGSALGTRAVPPMPSTTKRSKRPASVAARADDASTASSPAT